MFSVTLKFIDGPRAGTTEQLERVVYIPQTIQVDERDHNLKSHRLTYVITYTAFSHPLAVEASLTQASRETWERIRPKTFVIEPPAQDLNRAPSHER